MWYREAKENKHRKKHHRHHRKVRLFDDFDMDAPKQVEQLPGEVEPALQFPPLMPSMPAPATGQPSPVPEPPASPATTFIPPTLSPGFVLPPQKNQPRQEEPPVAPESPVIPEPQPPVVDDIDEELDGILNGQSQEQPQEESPEGATAPEGSEESPIKGVGGYQPPINPLMKEPPVHENCHCTIKTLPGGRQVWEAGTNSCERCAAARDAFNQMQDMLFQGR